MKIDVQVIPHAKQRYPTSGDWWVDKGSLEEPTTLRVRVSKLPNEAMEMLVAHHEITEALLCIAAGIDGKDVDAFDIAFEKARVCTSSSVDDFVEFLVLQDKLGHPGAPAPFADSEEEPGDHPAAPYYKQHQFATGFERIMAAEMGVDWTEYENANNAL